MYSKNISLYLFRIRIYILSQSMSGRLFTQESWLHWSFLQSAKLLESGIFLKIFTSARSEVQVMFFMSSIPGSKFFLGSNSLIEHLLYTGSLNHRVAFYWSNLIFILNSVVMKMSSLFGSGKLNTSKRNILLKQSCHSQL